MELFNYTVTALASAVTNPTTIIMMFVLGFLFYSRNKKIAIINIRITNTYLVKG